MRLLGLSPESLTKHDYRDRLGKKGSSGDQEQTISAENAETYVSALFRRIDRWQSN